MALLRGINVGGKNKVDMKQLKAVFEDVGMTSVRTYINSGNVIFDTTERGRARVTPRVEKAIAQRFGFEVKVLLRDLRTMRALVHEIPRGWTDDAVMRCYVMFLWDPVARPSVLKQVTFKPEMDDVRYIAGAIVWRVDRKNITRSGMTKMMGTPLYKQMTIRSVNTTRKLLELMEAS
ncbi:MAG: DUF1697 domain-containing protein [Actinomycetota bacterium]